MNNKKIDFFVLGVQKSGTTTLHNWLIQNPQICLPNIKETHYFSSNYSKGIKWYLSQFYDDDCKIKGEVDPSYIYCKDSAMNIKEYIDKPKFIIILRKPIDRAYSHYLMSKYRGYESDTFINAIKNEKNIINKDNFSFYNYSYLSRGYYYEQLSYYKTIFPDSLYHFIKFDDIINSDKNKSVYDEICDFLEIDNLDINLDVVYNRAKSYKSKSIRDFIYNNDFIKKVGRYLFKSDSTRVKIKKSIEKYNTQDIKSEKLNEEKIKIMNNLDSSIISWNNEQVELLGKVTKLDLNDWII